MLNLKKLLSIFVCLFLVFSISGCSNSDVAYMSGDEFTSQMKTYDGYEVYDLEANHPDVSRIVCASKEKPYTTFFYYEMKNDSYTKRFYEMNKGPVDLSDNGLKKSEKIDGSNYYIISQKGKSFIIAQCKVKDKSTILEILSTLGY